jgi:hypothetical protein
MVAILASQWRRVRVTEAETALKQQMLDRGMPAAEIERVIKASADDSSGLEGLCASEEEKSERTALVEAMLENGMEAADVERVLRALGSATAGESAAATAEKVAVVKTLVENELSAEDIERVLHAFDARPSRGTAESAVRRL